jgi:hypothetical protein
MILVLHIITYVFLGIALIFSVLTFYELFKLNKDNSKVYIQELKPPKFPKWEEDEVQE